MKNKDKVSIFVSVKKYIVFLFAIAILSVPVLASADVQHFTRNLSVGSSGVEVRNLQMLLIWKGYLKVPKPFTAGYFGSATKAAVTKYQAKAGILASGTVGPLTRTLLDADFYEYDAIGGDATATAAVKQPPLRKCPDQKVVSLRTSFTQYTKDVNNAYYMLNGEKRDMSEFDQTWVNKNCLFPVNTVY